MSIVKALNQIQITESGVWNVSTDPDPLISRGSSRQARKSVEPSNRLAFAKYLAASTFVHCGDAWGYLGRAMDSLARGDIHAAVHLTYYAELRGALSLLASEGIYIGNYSNFVLLDDGSLKWLNGDPTHTAVWKALDTWHEQSRAKKLISRILRPVGTSLDEWIQGMPNQDIGYIISTLLERMSMDLKSFSIDRSRRNVASYMPTRLTITPTDADKANRIISQIWRALEPSARGTFPILDQLILKDILRTAYANHVLHSEDDMESIDKLDPARWRSWLHAVAPPAAKQTANLKDLEEIPTDPTLSQIFLSNHELSDPSDFIESMLMRTTVLLRLATGSCHDLISESLLEKRNFLPWVNSLSYSRGLWQGEEGLNEDMLDLWIEVEELIEVLDEDVPTNTHSFLDLVGVHLRTLGQTERVVAWNFA